MGNVVNPVEVAAPTFLLPMSNSCFEGTFANRSSSRNTQILVFNGSVITFHYKFDDFKQTFSFLSTVYRGMTERVTKTTGQQNHGSTKNILVFTKILKFPFNAFSDLLCVILNSSQAIKLHTCRIFTVALFSAMLQVSISLICTFSDNFKAECAYVRLLKKSQLFQKMILTKNIEIKDVFTVLSRASRKYIPSLP